MQLECEMAVYPKMQNGNVESTLENVCNKCKKTKTINVEIVTFLGRNEKRNTKRKEENKCITKKKTLQEKQMSWYS